MLPSGGFLVIEVKKLKNYKSISVCRLYYSYLKSR